MPHWFAWLELAFGMILLALGAAQWRQGGRVLAVLGLLVVSGASRDLLPPDFWWLRIVLWIGAAVLLALAAVRLPREAYVKARVDLILGALVVALILVLELAPLPRVAEMPLVALLGVLFVACMLRLLVRSLRTPV